MNKPKYKIILGGQPLEFFNSAEAKIQSEFLSAFKQLQKNPFSGKNIEMWDGKKWVPTVKTK